MKRLWEIAPHQVVMSHRAHFLSDARMPLETRGMPDSAEVAKMMTRKKTVCVGRLPVVVAARDPIANPQQIAP